MVNSDKHKEKKQRRKGDKISGNYKVAEVYVKKYM